MDVGDFPQKLGLPQYEAAFATTGLISGCCRS
jgi:hypothetical protein